MEFSKLLQIFDSLNLPQDTYVLVGSAPLAVRGIRDASDLDVVVSDQLWDELRQTHPIIDVSPLQKINMGERRIDILGQCSMFQNPIIASVEQIIQTADIIEGHRFLNLELLKKFKTKLGRDKDLKDIELIDQYLAQQNK